MVDHGTLHDDSANQDGPCCQRGEYTHFAACEHRHCGYQRTSSYDNRQQECRNGVVTERPALQLLDWQPLGWKCSDQKSYAPTSAVRATNASSTTSGIRIFVCLIILLFSLQCYRTA
jgi:hypothetical protein